MLDEIAPEVAAQHERLVESVLKILWDLKLKVGHSIRSTADLLALAKSDMTVRTALLEARLIWGEREIFADAMQRFRAKVVAGSSMLPSSARARRGRRPVGMARRSVSARITSWPRSTAGWSRSSTSCGRYRTRSTTRAVSAPSI